MRLLSSQVFLLLRSEHWDGFLVLMFGYLVGLLYPKDSADSLKNSCRDALTFARDTLDVTGHCTVSTRWIGPENVERANRMVQDIELSRAFYGDLVPELSIAPEDSIQKLVDREQQMQFEQTFFQATERICGTVRTGDPQAVALLLREQLMRIAENCVTLPYPDSLNLTINRFISLLQYRLMEEDLADWRKLQAMDFSRELISCGTVSAFLDAADQIAEIIVAHAREREESRHDSLMRDIRSYLENNATDVNIGLTAVARTFHLTPREAAESFRAYFGISVNDVIHRARVKRAKELLLTTNDSVQSIAEAVGYCSLATMYRAFSNIEGVAPGKLRQLQTDR